MSLQFELDEAVDIARETSELLLSYFGTERVEPRLKGTRDVVTAADVASEELVIGRLTSAFPNDAVTAEEGSKVDAPSGRRWYVDPLDGTLNYSRGLPIWCVSLSLFDRTGPLLGVICDPIRQELFSAARGLGAWRDGRKMQCVSETKISDAFVHLTVDFNDDSMLLSMADLQALAPVVLRTRNLGSAALALAYVAAGRIDAMLHRFAHTWDYGAGVLMVQEAGGVVTDLSGQPYSENTTSLLAAANLTLHSALTGALMSDSEARVQ